MSKLVMEIRFCIWSYSSTKKFNRIKVITGFSGFRFYLGYYFPAICWTGTLQAWLQRELRECSQVNWTQYRNASSALWHGQLLGTKLPSPPHWCQLCDTRLKKKRKKKATNFSYIPTFFISQTCQQWATIYAMVYESSLNLLCLSAIPENCFRFQKQV